MNDPSAPAFPLHHNPEHYPECPTGITVRDYFAAAAMRGLLASGDQDAPKAKYAMVAYQYADAMIAQRSKSAEPTERNP